MQQYGKNPAAAAGGDAHASKLQRIGMPPTAAVIMRNSHKQQHAHLSVYLVHLTVASILLTSLLRGILRMHTSCVPLAVAHGVDFHQLQPQQRTSPPACAVASVALCCIMTAGMLLCHQPGSAVDWGEQ